MLQPEWCRRRQQRLLDVMQRDGFDAVVVGSSQQVYYFTGYRPFWLHEAAFVIRADGATWLVCGREPESPVAADTVVPYESNWLGTQRQEQAHVVAEHLESILIPDDRVAIDASSVTSQVGGTEIDEHIWQLRRRKDPDEIALMRKAIDCTKAMYDRARAIIEPGVSELRIYNELHQVAVDTAGELLTPAYLGNDFACAAPGGPPRAGYSAKAGELYILDLGPAYRGYFADNCRTFAVDQNPSDKQMKAWEVVTGVFPIIERMAKPGVRCVDLFAAVNDHYQSKIGKPFPHHVGHGVGLQPHEFPHLNPKWDDVLMEGEVFTVEPGMYSPELRAGMRIENQYFVTATGVENMTPFPLALV